MNLCNELSSDISKVLIRGSNFTAVQSPSNNGCRIQINDSGDITKGDLTDGTVTKWENILTNADLGIGLVSSGAFEDITQAGIYYVANSVTGKPDPIGGLYVVASPYNDGITQTGLFIVNNTSGGVYKVVRSSGSQNVTRIDQ